MPGVEGGAACARHALHYALWQVDTVVGDHRVRLVLIEQAFHCLQRVAGGMLIALVHIRR